MLLPLLALAAQPAVAPPISTQPAVAQPVAPPPAPVVVPPLPEVTLTTTLGPIVVRIETRHAPVTAANFLRYVDAKRMDGFVFYRTSKSWGPGSPLIQAGNRGDPRTNFPPIAHEPTNITGLTHCKGALSMARLAPGDATSDFFLLLAPIAGFDADPAASGDNAGFAVFGEVVSGLDVARQIYDAPVSPTEGEGVMKGQMLAPPVTILTARRTLPKVDLATVQVGCIVKAP